MEPCDASSFAPAGEEKRPPPFGLSPSRAKIFLKTSPQPPSSHAPLPILALPDSSRSLSPPSDPFMSEGSGRKKPTAPGELGRRSGWRGSLASLWFQSCSLGADLTLGGGRGCGAAGSARAWSLPWPSSPVGRNPVPAAAAAAHAHPPLPMPGCAKR